MNKKGLSPSYTANGMRLNPKLKSGELGLDKRSYQGEGHYDCYGSGDLSYPDPWVGDGHGYGEGGEDSTDRHAYGCGEGQFRNDGYGEGIISWPNFPVQFRRPKNYKIKGYGWGHAFRGGIWDEWSCGAENGAGIGNDYGAGNPYGWVHGSCHYGGEEDGYGID